MTNVFVNPSLMLYVYALAFCIFSKCVHDPTSPWFYLCFSSFMSTISWRDYRFPIGNSWLLYPIFVDRICWNLILDSLFCFIGWYVSFCATARLYFVTMIWNHLESRSTKPPTSFSCCRNFLVIWNLLQFHTNFRIISSISI